MTKSELRRLVMIGAAITSTIAGVVACAVGAGPGRGAGSAGEPQVGTTLKRAAVIDLPGPPGRRFDYLTIDDDTTTCSPLISEPGSCM